MAEDDDFREILDRLHEQRAIDFSAYRQDTIRRRIRSRLSRTDMPDYASYLHYLSSTPEEMDLLLNALTISVSHFFRNPLVFELLRECVIPELIASSPRGGVRIWSVGCSRGEEAYSVAILAHEVLGTEGAGVPIRILATDIDTSALAAAAEGIYAADAVQEVKKRYLDRYFTAADDGYRINDEIRRLVTFARHDATTCVPPREGLFSDYHLILCRNTMIYFTRPQGERVLSALVRSLAPGGILVLGEAERIAPHIAINFREIVPQTRVYRKEARECSIHESLHTGGTRS